jgi:hypothetical protein
VPPGEQKKSDLLLKDIPERGRVMDDAIRGPSSLPRSPGFEQEHTRIRKFVPFEDVK